MYVRAQGARSKIEAKREGQQNLLGLPQHRASFWLTIEETYLYEASRTHQKPVVINPSSQTYISYAQTHNTSRRPPFGNGIVLLLC
jgi:hypothetical protein